MCQSMYYKFVAYIPTSDLDGVKQALFDAGAGQFGHYTQCSWQVLGVGQFSPKLVPIQALGRSAHSPALMNGE